MKKLILIFSILFLISLGVISGYFIKKHYDNMPYEYPDGKIEYDFSRQSQTRASKILYQYILDTEKMTPAYAKKHADISQNNVYAFTFDLNNDGEDEIIGFADSFYYCGTMKKSILILQKQNNKYQNIVKYHICHNSLKVYILPKKTNGYNDILLLDNEKNIIKQYHKGYYYSVDDYESLKDYIVKSYDKELPKGTIKYDIVALSQPKASKILYQYILEVQKLKPKETKEAFFITPEKVHAIEVDLNNDGQKEIIGFCDSSYFSKRSGETTIFILKNFSGKYKSITSEYYMTSAYPEFFVLPDKTNNYKDIIILTQAYFENKPVFVRFYNNSYGIK